MGIFIFGFNLLFKLEIYVKFVSLQKKFFLINSSAWFRTKKKKQKKKEGKIFCLKFFLNLFVYFICRWLIIKKKKNPYTNELRN